MDTLLEDAEVATIVAMAEHIPFVRLFGLNLPICFLRRHHQMVAAAAWFAERMAFEYFQRFLPWQTPNFEFFYHSKELRDIE